MLNYFVPDMYIEDFSHLDIAALEQLGIKVLVCDIDNTLVPFDIAMPTTDVRDFIMRLKRSTVVPVLISNNHNERVMLFAKDLDVAFYPMARKPLKLTYRKMLKDYGLPPEQVACMGDQLMTDVFGAKRCHLYTILTKPLVKRDIHYTKINRQLEKIVFFLLRISGKFDRSKYDA